MNRPSDSRRSLRSKISVLSLGLGISLLSFLSFGCKGIHFTDEQSYGLRLVSVKISPEDYGLLDGQVFSKRPVQADIRIDGELKVYCRISYAGRSSLDAYRKSYDLDFCNEKYNKRTGYRLSAQAIDKTMVRSILGYKVFKAAGIEVPKAELAVSYINKEYKGLYLFMEVVDKEFYKAHKLEIREVYKARYGNASFRQQWSSNPSEAFSYDGKGEDNFTYINEIYKLLYNEKDDEVFSNQLSQFFDTESFLSYMAAAVVLNHWDGFDNNYFLAFDTGKRKLFTSPWDLDRIWEKSGELQVEELLERNLLLQRLLRIEAHKKFFLEKVTSLNKSFDPEKLIESMKKLQGESELAYREDPILHRYQDTAFVELEANIRTWDQRVKEYLVRTSP